MKTNTEQTMEANKLTQYHENAALILQLYTLVKKENAIAPPRLPANDWRQKAVTGNANIYHMQSSHVAENAIIKMPFLKQLATKVAAVFF